MAQTSAPPTHLARIARPRPGLTRPQIVAAALELVDDAGLSALTMRRLGARLGVDPMAIYHHLPDKAALFDGLVEAIFAEIVVDPAVAEARDWRGMTGSAMRQLRAALRRHPNVVPVVGTRPAATPTLFAVIEQGLAVLQEAGFDSQAALDILSCLTTYTIGQCLAEVGQPVGGGAPDPAASLAQVDSDEFPRLVQALGSDYRYDPDAQFGFGLDAMLSGIADPTI